MVILNSVLRETIVKKYIERRCMTLFLMDPFHYEKKVILHCCHDTKKAGKSAKFHDAGYLTGMRALPYAVHSFCAGF